MNLKDAFWAQNKLQALMDKASGILQGRDNILKVTTTHLRSKVMPEALDAVAGFHVSTPSLNGENDVSAFIDSFCNNGFTDLWYIQFV